MRRDTELERYTYSAPSPLRNSLVHPMVRFLSRALAIGGIFVLAGLLAAPWQQSVAGQGRVIAYSPTDRTQPIEAPIKGRITTWHVQEGSFVKQGDPVADIQDNDPGYLSRLERERDAAQDRVAATQNSIHIIESRLDALKAARDAAISNAQLYVSITRDKLEAAKQDLAAAEVEKKTADLNLTRQRELAKEGLTSTRKVELTVLKAQTADNKVKSHQAKVRALKREVSANAAKLENVRQKERSTIAKAGESLQKAKSDLAKAKADVAKAEVKVSRQQSMQVTAPVSGTIFRLVANGPGHFVKAGDQLSQIVPDVSSRAVEVWMQGNDAPLITSGRHVRLQFEGWPAVQFVGWPAVAVGTFGGTVAFVDATDDGSGKFRIVIVPDENS
ncbi:MAG: HlyD family efflux transporter periplasmic adaptor subunit, partial [Myxococcota bacterium]